MADMRLEIIYYKIKSDFEMEFRLAGSKNYKLRTITCLTKTPKEFVWALSRAVGRNCIIMVVGKLQGELELYDLIAKSTSHPLCAADLSKYGITYDYQLPEGATPLVTADNRIVGCLLENGVQSIIVLSDEKPLRDAAIKELIKPYLADIKSSLSQPVQQEQTENKEDAEQKEALPQEAPEPEAAIAVAADEPIEQEPPQKEETSEEETNEEAFEISSFSANDDTQDEPEYIAKEDGIIPKKKRGKKALRILLAFFIAFAILVVGGFSYFKFLMPLHANAVYKNAAELLGQNSESLPESALTRFGALYEKNSAFSGWLSIGGTDISLPVVSAQNKIDGYYTDHLYNGHYNLCGTPYVAKQFTADSYFRNIVIYTEGNWVNNYFYELHNYDSLEFYKSAPIITFDSLYSQNTWKIFSTFIFSGDNKPVDYEKDTFFDDNAFAEHINALAAASSIVTTVELSKDDEILTLVNKTENGKTAVVVARKTKMDESVAVDVDGAIKAENHSGPTGISSTPAVTSSELVSSNPLQEIVMSSKPMSSNKPVSSKKPVIKVENEDEPLSDEEIKQNLQNIQKPPVVTPSSKPQTTTPSSAPTTSTKPVTPSQNNWLPLTATRNSDGAQLSGSAIEIIAQICAAEMGSSYHPEALKAQAIAAYNWMLCNGGASGKYPRVPMKTANQKIIDAVTAVAGKCIYYNGNIAPVYYYAYSAGVTSNSFDYWNANNVIPYLTSVDSSVDKNHKNFQTMHTLSAQEVAKTISSKTGIDVSGVSDKTQWFKLTYCDNGTSPYVKTVTFGNNSSVYKGKDLRGLFSLKSSAIIVTYNKDNDTFTFTTKGYGHGVGMSQFGAHQYATQSGWTYDKILSHYYPGTTIK